MALFRWILGFILAALITAFALANRQSVDVIWSPFAPALNAPLYLFILAAMAAGFIIGALIVWMNSFRFRIRVSQQKRQIKNLEKELEAAHNDDAPKLAGKFLPNFMKRKTDIT